MLYLHVDRGEFYDLAGYTNVDETGKKVLNEEKRQGEIFQKKYIYKSAAGKVALEVSREFPDVEFQRWTLYSKEATDIIFEKLIVEDARSEAVGNTYASKFALKGFPIKTEGVEK